MLNSAFCAAYRGVYSPAEGGEYTLIRDSLFLSKRCAAAVFSAHMIPEICILRKLQHDFTGKSPARTANLQNSCIGSDFADHGAKKIILSNLELFGK